MGDSLFSNLLSFEGRSTSSIVNACFDRVARFDYKYVKNKWISYSVDFAVVDLHFLFFLC